MYQSESALEWQIHRANMVRQSFDIYLSDGCVIRSHKKDMRGELGCLGLKEAGINYIARCIRDEGVYVAPKGRNFLVERVEHAKLD